MISERRNSGPLGKARLSLVHCAAAALRMICCSLAVASLQSWAQSQQAARVPGKEGLATLLRAADKALKDSDFDTAVKALKSSVEIDPEYTPAWFSLGYAYTALHQTDLAIFAYNKTLKLQPDLFEARLNLGILLVRTKRPEASLEHLERAVTLKPSNARAHLYYGEALAQVKNSASAEKEIREALRLDPTLDIAAIELGQLFLLQKRYADARSVFEQILQKNSKLPQADLGVALAAEGLKDFDGAISHLEQYVTMKPDDWETRFHLARIYLQQGKNDRALENLETVYRAKPNLRGITAALGDVYALTRRFADSEKLYRQALAASPDESELHRALGRTLLDEEKFRDAEAEFRAALKLDPKNREAAKGLATSLYLEKCYEQAVPVLEALARAPDPPPILFFQLATSYDHLRLLPKALDAYDRFLEIDRGQAPDQEWQARQRLKVIRRELRK